MPAINFAGLAFISMSGIAVLTSSTFAYTFGRIRELEKKIHEMEVAGWREEVVGAAG